MTITLERPEPPRDRYGRYLITAPDGVGKAKPHTRVTTLAKTLSDTFALTEWAKRVIACGMAARPDLVALAHGRTPDDKAGLAEVIKAAEEAGGAAEGRRFGSAVHSMCERLDHGADLKSIPEAQRKSVEIYRDTLAANGITTKPEWIERIVVLAEHSFAGTFDRLVNIEGYDLPMVADLKTSKSVEYGFGEMCIQLACYAHADTIWDAETGKHEPMPLVNQDYGLIIHLPQTGEPRCELHLIDLKAGWAAVEQALWVRDWRKRRNLAKPFQIAPAKETTNEPAEEATEEATEDTTAAPEEEAVRQDDTPEVLAQRAEWLKARVIAAWAEKPESKAATAEAWPRSIPTFKQGGHTAEQLAELEHLIDRVEALYEVTFGPMDPTRVVEPPPEKPKKKRRGVKHEFSAKPKAFVPPKEGKTMEPGDMDALRSQLSASGPEDQARVVRWITEATDAGRPISTRELASLRRWNIARAMVLLAPAEAEGSADELTRCVLALVFGQEIQASVTVGMALGSLTIDEAERLATIARDVTTRDGAITFDESGAIVLATAA